MCRLEKIKQKRFRESKTSRLITDDDFIFTEHALDTKEDEMPEIKVDGFFQKKTSNPFIKLEGFDVKKKDENL